MLLTEITPVPDAALPVAAFRDHLRLGSGFADEGAEDALLIALLRAAMAAVEARTGKALLSRSFELTQRRWSDPERQVLPVAPIASVSRVVQIDAIGSIVAADSATWYLERSGIQPVLVGRGGALPGVPTDGAVRVEFAAGYGAAWSDVPADLALAVFMLAATYYENRFEARGTSDIMPHGVTALLEAHRPVRVGLGGGRA